MSKFRSYIQVFPEYYLIILVLLAGYTPPVSISPLSIILAVILVLQVIFKNKTAGLFITGIFGVINLYMPFALISEFNEFTSFTNGARNLLLGGLPIFALNILAIAIMLHKYSQVNEKTNNKMEVGI